MTDGAKTEHQPLFFPAWLRYATLGLSALSFVVGAVAVFATDNEIGTAAMVAASAGLILVVVFADRVQTLEAGPIKATLPRQAAKQLEQASVAEAQGRGDDAVRLRESARILLDGAAPMTAGLDALQVDAAGPPRTGMQHLLMSHTRALARASTSTDTVRELFGEGSDGDRLTAIAIMQARPELADRKALTAAVVEARSAHEQYQALVAIEKAVDAAPQSPESEALMRVAREALHTDTGVSNSTNRRAVAERIVGTPTT